MASIPSQWPNFILIAIISASIPSPVTSLSHTVRHRRHRNECPSLFTEIPRVKASDFDQYIHYYHDEDESRRRRRRSSYVKHGGDASIPRSQYETPVIVEGALSPSACETSCDTILSECGAVRIDLQRRRQKRTPTTTRGDTDIRSMTLERSIDAIMSSKHDDSRFVFCEGLLNDVPSEAISHVKAKFRECRENLFRSGDDGDLDWFELFPAGAKPSDCLVFAGEGATSTLHRDPFEWTGTSICLEGSKVWRFAPPPGAALAHLDDVKGDNDAGIGSQYRHQSGVHVIDEALDAYRLDSITWNDEDDNANGHVDSTSPLTLSAGWQSDFSFFAHRHKDVPTARQLDDIESEHGKNQKWKMIRGIATDPRKLRSDVPAITTDERIPTLWSGLQREGDMMVIPAYWWHQTYALEPSLAVASQRCGGARDASRMVAHVLDTVGCHRRDGIEVPKRLTTRIRNGGFPQDETPHDIVDELFTYLAKIKRRRM